MFFFSRIFNILRPLLRLHWAACCTKNDQPIRVAVQKFTLTPLAQMNCASTRAGDGLQWLRKKNTIFSEHPVATGKLSRKWHSVHSKNTPIIFYNNIIFVEICLAYYWHISFAKEWKRKYESSVTQIHGSLMMYSHMFCQCYKNWS